MGQTSIDILHAGSRSWIMTFGPWVRTSVLKLREGATYEEGGNYGRAFGNSGVARVAVREKSTRENFYGRKLPGSFFPVTVCFREKIPKAER